MWVKCSLSDPLWVEATGLREPLKPVHTTPVLELFLCMIAVVGSLLCLAFLWHLTQHLCLQALFSAGDGQLLPGGRTFGGVAGEVLGAEGLAAPVACREVFRFDAARVLRPDFPAARVRLCLLKTHFLTIACAANPAAVQTLGQWCRANVLAAQVHFRAIHA